METPIACHLASWKQPASLMSALHALDSDCESSETMRNLLLLRSSDHSAESLLQDPKQTINHFSLVPEKTLETLYPFKVGNDYTARVAKYIRDYKNFVPPFKQYLIGLDGRRSIGAFRQKPAANFPGILPIDDAATGSLLLQNLIRRGVVSPDEPGMGARVDAGHTVIGSNGKRSEIFLALGPLLRGTLWETVAVPELRGQARRVAETLLDHTAIEVPNDESVMMEYMI